MINLKKLIYYLAVALGTGALSAFATMGSFQKYKSLNTPPLSPPSFIFPIVWTVLFILMGIGAYLVYESECREKGSALGTFYVQLGVNFIWPILFFNMQAFFPAFLWLVFLWVMIILMIVRFYLCSHTAAYLQIPYLVWVTFAGYLNMGVYLLN